MRSILCQFELCGRTWNLPAYGTALVVALAVLLTGGFLAARLRKMPTWPSLAHVTALAVALPIGARFLYWAVQGDQAEMRVGLGELQPVGFLLPGGVLVAIAVAWLVSRVLRLDAWRMFDTAVPALGLAGAVLRLGCFGHGCCFGRETTLPWGVVFPWGSPAHWHAAQRSFDALLYPPPPVHPTQLYELAACLVVTVLAGWSLWRRAPEGLPSMVAATWLVVFRDVNSQFRAPAPFGPPGWSVDVLCTAILLGFWGVYWAKTRRYPKMPAA